MFFGKDTRILMLLLPVLTSMTGTLLYQQNPDSAKVIDWIYKKSREGLCIQYRANLVAAR